MSDFSSEELAIEKYIETGRVVGDPTVHHKSVSGEYYETIAVSARSLDQAIDLFRNVFIKYTMDKVGVLYWRCKPKIRFEKEKGIGDSFFVRARLLISDKPVIIDSEP